MGVSILAHWIGAIGEVLNFVGALIMALDIFLRRQDRERAQKLANLSSFSERSGLKSAIYKGFPASSADLSFLVLQRHATRLAYWGVGCFACGFSLLVLYHGLEIQALHLGKQCY